MSFVSFVRSRDNSSRTAVDLFYQSPILVDWLYANDSLNHGLFGGSTFFYIFKRFDLSKGARQALDGF